MGWCSGGELFARVAQSAQQLGSGPELRKFYLEAIEAFEDFDCDTLRDCWDRDGSDLDWAMGHASLKDMGREECEEWEPDVDWDWYECISHTAKPRVESDA